jgi:hypothetical protein
METRYKYAWYVIDTIVFIAINELIWAYHPDALRGALSGLGWSEIFILAMGAWRLTDIITHEGVTEFIREPFEGHEEGFRGFFGILVSCNSCMGVWVGMLAFYSYVLWPAPTLAFMVVMSLTFFERFFSKIYNVLEKRG